MEGFGSGKLGPLKLFCLVGKTPVQRTSQRPPDAVTSRVQYHRGNAQSGCGRHLSGMPLGDVRREAGGGRWETLRVLLWRRKLTDCFGRLFQNAGVEFTMFAQNTLWIHAR
jgi:hypothetical protein